MIYINYHNNAIINNYYYGGLRNFIVLFKISTSTRRNLLGIYRKFGLEPS